MINQSEALNTLIRIQNQVIADAIKAAFFEACELTGYNDTELCEELWLQSAANLEHDLLLGEVR